MDRHPIRQLFDSGIRCTINTDDPFSFGNKLTDEYNAMGTQLGFSERELIQVARNGFEVGNMPEAIRQEALDELNALEVT